MRPIKRIRLSDSIVKAIEDMVAEEGFLPGDKFYSENELVKILKVGRSSIREAVRILEVRGKVSVLQGKGIFISPSSRYEENPPFTRWVEDNEDSLRDHFEVRLILEPKMAERAASHATDEDIEVIQRAHTAFSQDLATGNVTALIGADKVFHRCVARATGNRTMYSLMKTMTTSLSEGWVTSLHVPARWKKTVLEHGTVLDAIRQREGKRAKESMERHLLNAMEDIRRSAEDISLESEVRNASDNHARRE
ncbi:MAG: FadR family transcriptional regulator [Fretibacterium sp.]|nr:FadR family transcriptional regulator [Fretibacterium sp.]